MSYQALLDSKAFMPAAHGIDVQDMPRYLKPFQADIARWALRRGRAAIFASTGLGKTRMELCFADAVERRLHQQSLIIAPLAVAEQIIKEAQTCGIADVGYAEDQDHATMRVPVTNYDRADRFDYSKFGAVVADESSILKAHESQTRLFLTDACQNVPFLLPATATPAPNDYVELGNHAEFLGVVSQKEMLSMFFVHEGSVRAGNGPEWRLKRHAERDFWRWLASWSVVVRHPRDLGYDEPGYDLPPLRKHQITVRTDGAPIGGQLFPAEARTLSERITARRDTIKDRIQAALDLISKEPDEMWIAWCGLNAEQEALETALRDRGFSVSGALPRHEKVERTFAWLSGARPYLFSKPSILGWGMNFQACRRMIFVGLNDSFEQLYQAIRRCWRFGQQHPVDAYIIATDLEGAVVRNIERKESDFERMYAAMAEHMRDLTTMNVRGGRVASDFVPANKIAEIPQWLS